MKWNIQYGKETNMLEKKHTWCERNTNAGNKRSVTFQNECVAYVDSFSQPPT